jgi:PTH1 family peptidyl-tRNA hydrolase
MPAKQREEYDVAVQEAADAVELIVTEGVDAAMRRYNVRDAGG